MVPGGKNMAAARSCNSTMAAGLKPILRAIVNAVRGPRFKRGYNAAKVGNATMFGDIPRIPQEMRVSAVSGASSRRGRDGTEQAAHRIEQRHIAHDGSGL